MKVILKIIITKEYKLVIQFYSKYKKEVEPCIWFNDNTIEICKENNTKSIHFVKEWIEKPNRRVANKSIL